MIHLEDKLQIECVRYFNLQYPDVMIIHIRNGGSLKSAIEGAKFKKMGVVAGVADLFVMCIHRSIGKLYHGLFIEMKAGKGQQTQAQKIFQEKVESAGYKYAICRSFEQFKNEVDGYL